ncbi:hypothetical protein ACWOFR_09135 [Carnobacterium gallinarum]|uniref:hypothetical protein n=1 Tax=Carnobacterium gallinarum TaxID=2749 RepID=UPI00055109FE|nr:hypothetical protein [Carnobacterium gallinarum]
MDTFKLYSSGDIVRDTGLLYFYRLLREINEQNQSILQPKLALNYLEFQLPTEEEFDLEAALFNQIINVELYQTFIQDLSAEKIDPVLINEWKQSSLGELRTNLLKAKIPTKQIDKIMKKSETIYFPYLRNSGKFGANAQSVQNFHRNLKTFIQLFFSRLQGESKEREFYGEGRVCGICHLEHAGVYDITHKYAADIVESLPEKQRIYRTDSKYLYTFQGSQNNTFSNYADYQQDSAICFSCEFFNLFFLLYIKKEKAKYLVSCQNLVHMEFLQRKIRMKQDIYYQQSFYYQVAKSTKSARIRLYQVATDPNKGLLLKLEDAIEFDDLLKQIKLMDFVDSFSFPEEQKNVSDLKQLIKRFILNKNNEMAYQYLLGNLINREANIMAYNWSIVVKFIEEVMKEGENYVGKV